MVPAPRVEPGPTDCKSTEQNAQLLLTNKQLADFTIQKLTQRVDRIEIDTFSRFLVEARHSAPGQACPSRYICDPEFSLPHQN